MKKIYLRTITNYYTNSYSTTQKPLYWFSSEKS